MLLISRCLICKVWCIELEDVVNFLGVSFSMCVSFQAGFEEMCRVVSTCLASHSFTAMKM